jgi:hypothetical protein
MTGRRGNEGSAGLAVQRLAGVLSTGEPTGRPSKPSKTTTPMTDTTSPRVFIRSKRSGQTPQPVALLARTGGQKNIKVRQVGTNTPRTFGVYPFDLVDERGQRIAQDVLDKLPWQGAGEDPLGGLAPVTARMPASTPMPVQS